MQNTTNTELDYKLLTKIHDDLSKLASRIAWRRENLQERKLHLEGVSDEAERTKLNEGIKRSESVLNNLMREYSAVSSKLVVGRSEQCAHEYKVDDKSDIPFDLMCQKCGETA